MTAGGGDLVHGGGAWHEVEVTGVPLVALGERFLGALSLFWRPDRPM